MVIQSSQLCKASEAPPLAWQTSDSAVEKALFTSKQCLGIVRKETEYTTVRNLGEWMITHARLLLVWRQA